MTKKINANTNLMMDFLSYCDGETSLLEIAEKKPQLLQKALTELISLLDENKINPHATNEFGWNEIAEAHDGLEKSKFVGKVFINLTK